QVWMHAIMQMRGCFGSYRRDTTARWRCDRAVSVPGSAVRLERMGVERDCTAESPSGAERRTRMLSFRLVPLGLMPLGSGNTSLVGPAVGREVRMRAIRFLLHRPAGPLSIGWSSALLPFCLVALLHMVGAAGAQPSEPRVIAFSPHGTVKSARQVQAVFSAPM